SRGLLRRFAKSAGITVSREYLGIPAAASPTCYVEDTPEAVRYFVSHVLALPRGGMAASAVLAGARAAARFSWPRNFLGAVVTTALQGTPMTVRYHSWHHVASPAAVRQDFAMAERWLAKFQASVSGERNPIELTDHAADILFQRFGAEDRFPPVMDRLIAIQKRLGAQRSP